MVDREPSPAGVRVRPACTGDLPRILDLTVTAFGERHRMGMTKHIFEDPGHQLHQSRLAEVDGVIASYVRVNARTLRYGAATLPMGGIGSVCSLPEYRGRGLCTAVLADSIAYMRAEGYVLSMLFTGIHGFYARLGWVPFPESVWHVPLTTVAERSSRVDGARRFVETTDLPSVQEVHAAYTAHRTGMAVRTARSWNAADTRLAGILPALVVERGGRVVSYASLRVAEGTCHVYEAGCLPGHEAAFMPLARAILGCAREAGAGEVELTLGDTHGLLAAMRAAAGTVARCMVQHHTMIRLLDLPGLLRAARPALQERLAAHSCAGHVGAAFGLTVAGQYARLGVADGGVIADAAPAEHRLTLPQELFWRLFFGTAPAHAFAEELATVAQIQLSARDWALLGTLFPYQDPIYWRPDGF